MCFGHFFNLPQAKPLKLYDVESEIVISVLKITCIAETQDSFKELGVLWGFKNLTQIH